MELAGLGATAAEGAPLPVNLRDWDCHGRGLGDVWAEEQMRVRLLNVAVKELASAGHQGEPDCHRSLAGAAFARGDSDVER
jgi:hypothetical protein